MSQTGIVFNIQKFSIHDGPGIRTTVFLKGCPLSCKWCANPESQISAVQILYDETKCLHCGKCASVCPQKAISIAEEHRVHIDFGRCAGCLTCVHGCPGRALSFEGEQKTVEEVLAVCMQDLDFYEESGGGVTISGGEGMMQPDFTEALIRKLKDNGIHTAIETTGYVGREIFQRLAPLFDLLLFDIKHYDPEKHREGTGVRNDLILENLSWAVGRKLTILPRIPVIPGFNSELSDAAGIAALLKRLGLPQVQLLPFHQMGERKYEFLGRDYFFRDKKALHPEDLTDYQKIFLEQGIRCFFHDDPKNSPIS